MTKQKEIILQVVQNSIEHLTADEIYMAAKELMPSIAVGTVYRNLGLMVADGEISKVSVHNGPDRYDRTLDKHYHLTCRNCGNVRDISLNGIDEFLQNQIDEEVLSSELHIYHLCENCK